MVPFMLPIIVITSSRVLNQYFFNQNICKNISNELLKKIKYYNNYLTIFIFFSFFYLLFLCI